MQNLGLHILGSFLLLVLCAPEAVAQRFTTRPSPIVSVHHGNGSISIKRSESANSLELRVISHSPGLKVGCKPQGNNSFSIAAGGPGDSSAIELLLPDNCVLDLQSHGGNVSIEGVNGTHNIRSFTGDISLALLRGDLKLESQSGDILLRGIGRSTIKASCSSSSINYSQGYLAGGPYTFSSRSGDINIFHFEDASYTLEGSTQSGEINSFVNGIHVEEGKAGAMRVSGRKNKGSAQVRISSGSGYIMIGLDTSTPPTVGELDGKKMNENYIKSLNLIPHGMGCPCHQLKKPTLETGF